MSQYQKGKTNLDFTEARDSAWQWHQLGHMQVCTSLQTDNHASTPPLSFLQVGCLYCHPTNSVKALNFTENALQTGTYYSRKQQPVIHCVSCLRHLKFSAVFAFAVDLWLVVLSLELNHHHSALQMIKIVTHQ